MKRVMIIGCCGAGKSTLARKLQPLLGLEVFHLDQLYFSPNWVEMEQEAWKTKATKIALKKEWIIDGNYGGSMDVRLQHADTILFLDFPRWKCLYRVIKRILKYYGKQRPDSAEGCKERFDWEFLAYVFHFVDAKRPAILQRLKKVRPDQNVWIFKNDKDTDEFLKQIKS